MKGLGPTATEQLISNEHYLARGAIPLALPNSNPCIRTGIPLFPAAIAAVWLIKTLLNQV